MEEVLKLTDIKKITARAPINIALIKYWGKEDEDKIIPLNNSISLTLDVEKFYTETSVKLQINLQEENKTEVLSENTIFSLNGK